MFVTGVAGWQCEIIVFIGYEVGVIVPVGPSLGGLWEYVIGWWDYGMVI